MAERIVDLATPPVIGEKYMVPCYKAWSHNTHRRHILPVTGPHHSDPEIGGAGLIAHVHIDWRFVSDRQAWDVFRVYLKDDYSARRCYANALFDGSPHDLNPTGGKGNDPVSIGDRLMVCRRELPTFIRPSGLTQKVERLCDGKRLNLETMLCPHKGVPLASIPQDSEGCVTCPGHGLRWNVRTGKLVLQNRLAESWRGE